MMTGAPGIQLKTTVRVPERSGCRTILLEHDQQQHARLVN
jgi:hypothetical protein